MPIRALKWYLKGHRKTRKSENCIKVVRRGLQILKEMRFNKYLLKKDQRRVK